MHMCVFILRLNDGIADPFLTLAEQDPSPGASAGASERTGSTASPAVAESLTVFQRAAGSQQ